MGALFQAFAVQGNLFLFTLFLQHKALKKTSNKTISGIGSGISLTDSICPLMFARSFWCPGISSET